MWKQLLPAFGMTLLMTVLTGLIYPAAITGICQLLFKTKANGSMTAVGSTLIGQSFSKPEYFHPRASNSKYDALASGGFNDGPTSKKLIDRVQADADRFHKE